MEDNKEAEKSWRLFYLCMTVVAVFWTFRVTSCEMYRIESNRSVSKPTERLLP